MTQTVRLTIAQALVKFLSSQYSERDGVEQRLVTGMLGIFGHGNVAGVGQALLQAQVQGEEGAEGDDVLGDLPYYLARATSRARCTPPPPSPGAQPPAGDGRDDVDRAGRDQHGDRRGAGDDEPHPGAALPARPVRQPVPDPVLQQLEDPGTPRRHGQRRVPPGVALLRPDQPARAADPLADERDAGAHRPGRHRGGHRLPARRTSRPRRTTGRWPSSPSGSGTSADRCPSRRRWRAPSAVIRSAKRPLVVAGGGVVYSEASEELRAFAAATGIPVSDTHAGKGAINWDHPSAVGAVGSTARRPPTPWPVRPTSSSASAPATPTSPPRATRCSRTRTCASSTSTSLGFDAAKHGATMLVADAREALPRSPPALEGWRVGRRLPPGGRRPRRRRGRRWSTSATTATTPRCRRRPRSSEPSTS